VSGNLEGTVPDAWMSPAHVDDVIAYVRALALPARLKQRLFAKWAMTVKYEPTPGDFAFVTGRRDSRTELP
jgi:hypothetical protein